MELSIECPRWEEVPSVAAVVERAAGAAFAAVRQAPAQAEVSIALIDDAAISKLNRDFRGNDQPTNVLSFPASPLKVPGAPTLLGDVAVAFETTAAEAAADAKSIADHLAHLVVHGVLHLMGYDHIDTEDAELMEAAERDILAALGIVDPYAARDAD
ncbi:MAG: rRNA maturation RNase YbeY [Blastochloris sp.]|nr:rRNA maturation RNase YbeY [Blastochloris sp.]